MGAMAALRPRIRRILTTLVPAMLPTARGPAPSREADDDGRNPQPERECCRAADEKLGAHHEGHEPPDDQQRRHARILGG
jgi:hypothetical protein